LIWRRGAFAGPGLQGLTSEGTYAPFSVAIRASGAELVLVPQREFAFDLKGHVESYHAEDRRDLFGEPQQSTGSASPARNSRNFSRAFGWRVVVLDKRYIDYRDEHGLGGMRWRLIARGESADPADVFQKFMDGGCGIGYAIDGPSCFPR